MSELSAILKKIKSGDVEGLLNSIKEVLSSSSATAESQQLIRHCSRYIYDQPNITQAKFSHIVDIVVACCEHQHGQSIADPSFHLKSMYYLILIATKRKEFHQYLTLLLSDVEPYLNACNATSGDTHSIVKNMYLSIWNASLVAGAPLQALTLQQYSLVFLLATGASITKVCDQAMQILSNYEHVNKSLGNAEKFCLAVINCVTRHLKKGSSYSGDVVLSLIHIVLQYAKSLTISGKCSEFSKTTRLLVTLLEEGCNQNTILALKVGLKLTEVGMALKVGKCQEEMMGKFIQSCIMVPNETLPSKVMLLSLLYTASLFEDQNKKHSLSPGIMGSIVDNILARCDSSLSEDNAQRVAGVLCQQLIMYVDMMKTTKSQIDILKQALPCTLKANTFMSSHFRGKCDAVFHVYNVGVNIGNLGVMAFKGGSYDLAAQFLEASVEMLLIYSTSVTGDQKASVNLSLYKKLVLWSDALRYSGSYWESAVAACRGMLIERISADETVAIWVKCKRDAEKADNIKLRGLTICDVLRDATNKFKTTLNTGFDSFTLLQCEISNYKKQSHDTAEDQLSCGRAVIDCAENVEGKIYGYLAITEALWKQPSLAAQKDEALQTTKKAVSLIAENKGREKCINSLLELEALSYFWLYLCHLQQIQDVTEAEVQEAGKPVSLSVQATDLGEEVQVDDACDVRPSSTYLTLHAQEISLASLSVALSIWEKLDSKGVNLEDASTCFAALASTAYVFQLSGIVTPTVRSWTVLISLACRHSNKIYFIKGVTELLFIVPELLSREIIKEVEKQMDQCQESETQDSSVLYLSLCLTVASAYYHLKNGQYKEGGVYLKQAMENELMKKRTIRATEVQALVNYVASLYAWLPPWVMEADYKLPQPCISLAMLASRQALAVLKTPAPAANDVICWRHRIGWLHIITTVWLGNLCWSSAQPRLARAYLKQSLSLTQELALPLRTGELLELLARVDLLCDQFDDCLVKVDSLLALLTVHPSNPQAFTAMSQKSEMVREAPQTYKDGTDHPAFQIFSSDNYEEENIRDCSNQDFDLKSVSFDTRLIVVGPAERVSQLSVPQCPPSPSLRYREETSIVQFEPCSQEKFGCQVCSTPAVHQLRMSAAVLFAYILAYKGNFWPSKKNLCQFKEMFDAVSQHAPVVCNQIMSSVKDKWKNKDKSSVKFFEAKLNLVHLQSLHCQAQFHVLDDELEEAAIANIQALEVINSLDCQLLLQDVQYVTIIILQRHALQMALNQKGKESSSTDIGKSEELDSCQSDVEEASCTTFKTPARHLRKRLDGQFNTKTSHRLPRKSTKAGKEIYDLLSSSDEDDEFEDKNTLNVPSGYINKFTKTSGKQMSSSLSCQTLTSKYSKKQNFNVAEIEEQMNTLSLDTGSSGRVLKVSNPVSSPDCFSKSYSKGAGNINDSSSKVSESKGRENKYFSKAYTERKKRVAKNAPVPATPTVLIFSDKESPNSADDVEFIEKEELKPTRGRPKKISTEKTSREDHNKRAASVSKSKSSEIGTRIKTRSSRTIR